MRQYTTWQPSDRVFGCSGGTINDWSSSNRDQEVGSLQHVKHLLHHNTANDVVGFGIVAILDGVESSEVEWYCVELEFKGLLETVLDSRYGACALCKLLNAVK